jgi:hypothetical protein
MIDAMLIKMVVDEASVTLDKQVFDHMTWTRYART